MTTLPRLTCAAPAYLDRYGCPETVEDLARHRAVCLRSITTGALRPFKFQRSDGLRRVEVASPLSVTGTESFRDAVLLGLGLAQMPLFHIERDLAAGQLVRVLADEVVPAVPVSMLYPRNRQLSPRVRLFIDWVVGRFADGAASASCDVGSTCTTCQ